MRKMLVNRGLSKVPVTSLSCRLSLMGLVVATVLFIIWSMPSAYYFGKG